MKVTGVSAATILVLAIASPSHAQGIEVFGGYSANADYVQNRPAIRRSTGGCCIVTTWTMRASRTDASENWPTVDTVATRRDAFGEWSSLRMRRLLWRVTKHSSQHLGTGGAGRTKLDGLLHARRHLRSRDRHESEL